MSDGTTITTITSYFIGNYYEQTGSDVAKYYFTGATRIAMKKYTVPQNGTLTYLLGDHLGSTSITTDSDGNRVSEMRYTAWGEVRYSSIESDKIQNISPTYQLTKYSFTGRYSYMDDPSTQNVTEGFGLMCYNARWYDPSLGRFAQADSLVPAGVNPHPTLIIPEGGSQRERGKRCRFLSLQNQGEGNLRYN